MLCTPDSESPVLPYHADSIWDKTLVASVEESAEAGLCGWVTLPKRQPPWSPAASLLCMPGSGLKYTGLLPEPNSGHALKHVWYSTRTFILCWYEIRPSLKQASVACWKIFRRIPKSFTASVSGIADRLLKERSKTLLLDILICHCKR